MALFENYSSTRAKRNDKTIIAFLINYLRQCTYVMYHKTSIVLFLSGIELKQQRKKKLKLKLLTICFTVQPVAFLYSIVRYVST